MIKTKQYDEYGSLSVYEHDYIISREVLSGRGWSTDLIDIASKLPEGSHIIDIGAHCGMFSTPVLYKNRSFKSICFEPQRKMYELLVKNINDNDLQSRCVAHNCAVGSKDIENVSLDGGNEGYKANYDNLPSNLGGVAIGEGGEDGVKVVTLDGIGIDKCDLIKIDVEGAEPYVIEGAKDVIIKFKPVIIYETNEMKPNEYMRKLFGTPVDIDSFLKEVGYKNIVKMKSDTIAMFD